MNRFKETRNPPHDLSKGWPIDNLGEAVGASFEWPANVSPAQLARSFLEEIACQSNLEFEELLSSVIEVQESFQVGQIVKAAAKGKQGHPEVDHSYETCMSLEQLAGKVGLRLNIQFKLMGHIRGSGAVIESVIADARRKTAPPKRALTPEHMQRLVKVIRAQLSHRKLDVWKEWSH